MFRIPVLFTAILAAQGAEAHPGHIAEVAGHAHWLGAAAIGAAIGVALWLKWKSGKTDPEDSGESPDEEPQEPAGQEG